MSARFVSTQPGITSWHSFSAGAHYDPDNVAFGSVIGMDEHLLDPGAGFDWHGHRDVYIVSCVLDGALRHEDSSGEVYVVEPGEFLVQSTGDGVQHTETNASTTEPLRFLQLTLLGSSGGPAVFRADGSVEVGGHLVGVRTAVSSHAPQYVFDIASRTDRRITTPVDANVTKGELLVVELANPESENRR